MIKHILNRLPRRNSFDGNDPSSRSSVLSSENCKSDAGDSSASSSRELFETNHQRLVSSSRSSATGGNSKDGTAAPNGISPPVLELPLFRDVPLSERPALLISKLNLCSIVFDFRDPTKDLREKEIKKQTLLELVDFISAGSIQINERIIEETAKMVEANLFRALPPPMHGNIHLESFDFDDEDPAMEPAWPHLQVVYEFFLRFVASSGTDPRVAKTYINQSFVLKIIDLFDSEDTREREYLKTLLHRIYGKFMVHRAFIRKSINNVFYHFVFEFERHNGIAELLEILGSIINGFAVPLKEEHKVFLRRALIPLHKARCLAMYHRQLCYCMTQFIEKDFTLTEPIIKGLLKFWPLTNSQKEVLFLQELEEILEITQPDEFRRCMVPLLRQLGRCLNSPHFQVAERALYFWSNDHFVALVIPNRAVILPIIFPALERNTSDHWNQTIHGITMNARKLFLEADPELFQECKRRFKEEEFNAARLKEKQNLIWQQLEVVATKRGVI
ncbi:hypothetical protein KP509_01G019200 [Ceratopteris richardii]|uniref:Serine/threonine protein phosphatase 2A regulatory subunit n=1 Tax=Ceratopteris richardii TaxID=49495 RepID=A0A8T2VHU5_CERRI|nr:hypothetical protein KP509_01G019200 [Ceratopteris richardii]KAH7445664.1 hypothetical protein KP509_01G019200 [Ceratopteris richardii]